METVLVEIIGDFENLIELFTRLKMLLHLKCNYSQWKVRCMYNRIENIKLWPTEAGQVFQLQEDKICLLNT